MNNWKSGPKSTKLVGRNPNATAKHCHYQLRRKIHLPLMYCWFMTRVLTTSAGVPSTAEVRPEHALKYTKLQYSKTQTQLSWLSGTPSVFNAPCRRNVWYEKKLEWRGERVLKKSGNIFSHFDKSPECDRQTVIASPFPHALYCKIKPTNQRLVQHNAHYS